jgi:hypothetical protein
LGVYDYTVTRKLSGVFVLRFRAPSVDVRAFPGHSAVLGKDGDATLFSMALLSITYRRPFRGRQGARLAQQLVHGGLTMVNVGNDGDVRICYDSW